MRVHVNDTTYGALLGPLEYVAEQLTKPTPPCVTGPHKGTRCFALPDASLEELYDKDLGFWKLTPNQNIAVFCAVYYTENTDAGKLRLKQWLDKTFLPMTELFGGTYQEYPLTPGILGDSTNTRFAYRIEYAVRLMLLVPDPSVFYLDSKYPAITYSDLNAKVTLARIRPIDELPAELALELVERAHGVYTKKGTEHYYVDCMVSDEDLKNFQSPDAPLGLKQNILISACNRLGWFISSNYRENANIRLFKETFGTDLVPTDPNHNYFNSMPSYTPDFIIVGQNEIGIEHKTVDSLKLKFGVSSEGTFDLQTDFIQKLAYLKNAPAINTNDQTRYHGAKVCIAEVRETGECYWVYTKPDGTFCAKYLYNTMV